MNCLACCLWYREIFFRIVIVSGTLYTYYIRVHSTTIYQLYSTHKESIIQVYKFVSLKLIFRKQLYSKNDYIRPYKVLFMFLVGDCIRLYFVTSCCVAMEMHYTCSEPSAAPQSFVFQKPSKSHPKLMSGRCIRLWRTHCCRFKRKVPAKSDLYNILHPFLVYGNKKQ